ncbi:MAG: hypothetical protein CG439_1189 [Methylococcaceae bacterium NSP1-2]|nr:YdcF family protein [Methylococcaceae bacterium]OYV18691.1 MAG: hypothetical protein CG439_1189 [Methylococcaceae bacterium NSP1-2]
MKKIFIVASLVLVVLLLFTETAYWFGYRFSQDTGGTGNCAVLVLGYPTQDDGSDHPIQRLRVEAGVATYQANHCTRIVISGGAVANTYVEAQSMADIARTLGALDHDLVLETHARTTWENIQYSVSSLAQYDRIFIVSDSLHVHRAKRYACRQNLSLCPNVFTTGYNPPIELLWWKIPSAAHELYAWIRDFIIYERMETHRLG